MSILYSSMSDCSHHTVYVFMLYLCFMSSFLLSSGLPEGVKIISEALVKSVTFKDDKLEIKLKDGRLVGSDFHTRAAEFRK